MLPFLDSPAENHERLLESGDDQSSYLVDSNGDPYEPYSLAWRLLGTYMDCDLDEVLADNNNGDDEARRRRRLSGSGDGATCQRKLLWAVYHDPKYKGNAIGGYQFYDWRTKSWDRSSCVGKRCAKMDCHERRTRYQLVGVFAETDGMYDWAEQLFKHEGYCVWDGDKQQDGGSGSGDGNGGSLSDYEFMQEMLEAWKEGCQELYLTDSSGNTIYVDTTPMPGGDITYDIYSDEDCTQLASMTMYEYIIKFYAYYYYDRSMGMQKADNHLAGIERWNSLLTDFKVCQPCRAYNKVPTYGDDNNDRKDRFLRELEDAQEDGYGEEEPNGFNCYDDAGYRNCNQCYKFEAKTSFEAASQEDLERASAQGTILGVKVDGVWYGEPLSFESSDRGERAETILFITAIVMFAIVLTLWAFGRRNGKSEMKGFRRRYRGGEAFPGLFLESFMGSSNNNARDGLYKTEEDTVEGDDDKSKEDLHEVLAAKEKIIQEQREELARLRVELQEARLLMQPKEPEQNQWKPQNDNFSSSG